MDLLAFATGLISLALIYGLLAIGLNLQFGFAGVINFGYVAFFAVGAFASAIVTLPPPGSEAYLEASARYDIGLGLPIAAGFIAAALAGALLALFIGAVSARLATHYLAVATFAMAEVVRSVLGNETWLTRGEFGISNVPQPLGGVISPESYALFYLALTAVVVGLIFALLRRLGEKPFGRLLRAIKDDEVSARTLGKRTASAKLRALAIGGAVGGVAGALWTHSLGVVHVGQFVPIVTFQIWLAMLMGGSGNHWGALLGAFVLIAIREGTRFVGGIPGLDEIAAANPSFLPSLRFVLIGLLLIAVVRFFPGGLLPERRRKAPAAPGTAPAHAPPVPVAATDGPILEVAGLRKRFGGLAAVDGAGFVLRPGTITGLIGPNGAGKSTMIDLLSGVQRPDGGTVRLAGEDITGLTPEEIADKGLGRTFQTPRLYPSMTVWENLMVAGMPRGNETLRAGLWSSAARRRAEQAAAARAEAVLAELEIAHMRDELAGSLSGGQRKLLSLGRQMMRRPPLILLDEPAAGVNRRLAGDLFDRIAELNRQGTTFLIVEHEMQLIMRYCDRIVVMHQGRVLAEGTPEEIRANAEVIEAYLGGAVA
ncbi:ATP-binding cassette domain-containing protein [Aquicoccus sp. SCR17]|nr:ATP-binding cassette domain-containing protein [Carideicomes alvinocaridis]